MRGRSSTGVWTRYCGTAAKAGGQQRTQTSSCSSGRLLPTRREVYRARDTKLGRDVAIKVLPDEFAQDDERLRRFQREAKVLASLNHPNIAAIYGLEQSDDAHYLVLELVPGETLAERISRGPIPLDEALPLFVQTGEGLDAAHEKGVVHRDLKPANIKVTLEGQIKILDFGIAKAFANVDGVSAETSQSPTLTKGTALGTIMGTAAYMSPEQARGTVVDRRTDVWAFGCCLFEALTGKRAFAGEHVTDILAAVMRAEPDWGKLEPAHVRRVAERCLKKDRKQRFQHIGDARIALEDPAPFEPRRDTQRLGVQILLTTIATAALTSIFWNTLDRDSVTDAETMEFTIELPADRRLHTRLDMPALALTPNGDRLVFIGGRGESRQIYTRAMSDEAVLPIEGTEGVEETALFVSPNGEWVGFYRDETLWKTRIDGGIPVPILESREIVEGAQWVGDDTIFFRRGFWSPLYRVSSDGGRPTAVTELGQAQSEFHASPRMLPGGDTLLFSACVGNAEACHIEALSLQNGERKRVLDDAYFVEYVRSGHLVYGQQETVFAVPFDVSRVQVNGPATPVVTGVLMDRGEYRATFFAVSESGTLVYAPKREAIQNQLVWVSRNGEAERLAFDQGQFRSPRLSPDGSKLLVRSWTGSKSVIELMDLRRNVTSPLTTVGDSNSFPVWSPDGERVAFQSNRDGPYIMFVMPADGSGTPERLLDTSKLQQFLQPYSWSPEGELLLFVEASAEPNLSMLPMSSPGSTPILWRSASAEFALHSPRFSPDGRLVAYVSNESGRHEIYVSEFELGSDVRPRQKVSQSGGWEPVWSRDGRELYYRNADGNALLAVSVETERELKIGAPKKLFDTTQMPTPFWYGSFLYDVAPDGRFLMLHENEKRDQPMNLVVVLNWFLELERRVPTDN